MQDVLTKSSNGRRTGPRGSEMLCADSSPSVPSATPTLKTLLTSARRHTAQQHTHRRMSWKPNISPCTTLRTSPSVSFLLHTIEASTPWHPNRLYPSGQM